MKFSKKGHDIGPHTKTMKIIKSFCKGFRGTVFSKRVPLAAGGKKGGGFRVRPGVEIDLFLSYNKLSIKFKWQIFILISNGCP
ncbi:MAG: hypothetical protein PVH61_38490 [Candidatus Aminicenantes bacterium]|jgi:hypothetical protein